MTVARHQSGASGTVRALSSQVHPVFMLPPVVLSLLGGALSGSFAPTVAVVHVAAIFFAVYTAHVKDGYIDFHRRGEDDDHPMTPRGCRLALGGATVGFVACLGGLWLTAGPVAAATVAPTWLIGYLHAPVLDTNPVTATMGYPVGNALALSSATIAHAGSVSRTVLGLAGVLLVLLTGVKVVDDAQDYDYDRSIDKRTVVVALGPRRGLSLGFGLMAVALLLTVALTVGDATPFPQSAVFSVFAFAAVAAIARDRSPKLATMLLVRGAYVFLALLVAAVWFRPMQGPPPVDIGVLGGYTYLATEIAFGSVAFALLSRVDAVGDALRTIAMLYPVAYVWDWYTLEVGVFAIPLRTGVGLLGIPLEEHLFIVVVPAFVLALHETRRAARTEPETGGSGD